MAVTRPKSHGRIVFNDFLGVDFTSSETEVDARRSPNCVNMIADNTGRPRLRDGFSKIISQNIDKTLFSQYIGDAKGIFFHGETLILHTGRLFIAYEKGEDGKYTYNGKYFISGENSGRSSSFYMNEKTYFLDGAKYFSYDGEFCEVEGFIPTTSVGRTPGGAGTAFEAVNLLTRKRINSFTADGNSKEFILDGTPEGEVTVKICGVSTDNYTVTKNKVVFEEAPESDSGVDSVIVTFTASGEDKRSMIEKSNICCVFGQGNPSRVFVAGNPDCPATDFYSAVYDPTYFADTSYTKIGTEDSAIMGYLKQYGDLIIVKEEKDGRGGLFKREAKSLSVQNDDGSKKDALVFTVSEGAQGTGAAARGVILNAGGYPLYLSQRGLISLTTNSVTNQQSLKNMSSLINARLLREKGLEKACCAEYLNRLAIGINGNVYVAVTDSESSLGFEWFFWNGINATAMTGHDGKLYFAGSEAEIYRMNDKNTDGSGSYNDCGKPILAEWWSVVTDCSYPLTKKNINRIGTGIVFKPEARMSSKLYIRTDRDPEIELSEFIGDMLDFWDVDFNRFSFLADDLSKTAASKKTVKNVEAFQLGVKHNSLNDGLGILKLTADYTLTGKCR